MDAELVTMDAVDAAEPSFLQGYTGLVTAADLDGDLADELIAVSAYDYVLRAVGGADDSADALAAEGCSFISGDINGDGRDDLLSPSRVWLGDASGGVVAGSTVVNSDTSGLGCPNLIDFGDVDGDGQADFGIGYSTDRIPYGGPGYGSRLGGLELYLGASYPGDGEYRSLWPYSSTSGFPAVAGASLNADGDDASELIVLFAASADSALYGELVILDDLSAIGGPRAVARQDINEAFEWASSTWPTPRLEALGDLDGDGDDEVAVLLDGYTDGASIRVIEADASDDGIGTILGVTLELPSLERGESYDDGFPTLAVGDYDGDQVLDIAVATAWDVVGGGPGDEGGALSVWFGDTIKATLLGGGSGVPNERPLPATSACGCVGGAGGSSGSSSIALTTLLMVLAWQRRKGARRRA